MQISTGLLYLLIVVPKIISEDETFHMLTLLLLKNYYRYRNIVLLYLVSLFINQGFRVVTIIDIHCCPGIYSNLRVA